MWPLALIFAAYTEVVDGSIVFFFLACIFVTRLVPSVGVWMSYSHIERILYHKADQQGSFVKGQGKDPVIELLNSADRESPNDYDVQNLLERLENYQSTRLNGILIACTLNCLSMWFLAHFLNDQKVLIINSCCKSYIEEGRTLQECYNDTLSFHGIVILLSTVIDSVLQCTLSRRIAQLRESHVIKNAQQTA
jgi:hypothetical protein